MRIIDNVSEPLSDDLSALLDRLLAGRESEVVEFKEASRQFSLEKLGKYVSALSNEANLRGAESGWLVLGVSDDGELVGTSYLESIEQRQSVKQQIHQSIDQSLTVREIHEVSREGKRLLLFAVPPAPRGIPISWKGSYFGRAGESLVPLSLDKLDEIRRQSLDTDWSAVVVPEANLAHLDPAAIARARQGFKERHARVRAEDVDAWDDATFLDRIRLTHDGQITRAALLLLGAKTSTHLLTPHPAELTWRLEGEQQAYEHFYPPFLLSTTALVDRIRNVQMRLKPPNELIYREISKYEERSLLEALYNCIAHQDYSRRSRIIVTERPDRVEFISVGEFFDGAPEDYALDKRTPRDYRNPLLVTAMTELNVIDHMGYGIRRMVQDQVRRFLPLPDYDLNTTGEVHLTIHGAVIDEAFSQLLMVRTDLPFAEILALDRVQKGLPITSEAASELRAAGLVEGRRPRLRISSRIAAVAGDKAGYIRTRAQDDAHYARLVVDFIREYGHASRREIDDLLGKYLDEDLTPTQRRDKVSNVLRKMRAQGIIHNAGTRPQPRWELA